MVEFLAFRLDTVSQCLWRRTDSGEEERIRLPPRPFALLRYLVEHSGRLVTEDEILGAVWPKLYVQPESIKTQLHQIRKILGDDPKNPRYIETVPRRGHQFIAPVRESSGPDVAVQKRSTPGQVVGRASELSLLRDYLRAASKGGRQVVFVTGEPGIGKTALVDEFERQAMIEMPPLRIARGQCIEVYGGTEAYYPILEALGQLCVGSAAASVVEILAAQAPTWLVQFPALLTERHRELLQREIIGATRERMLREIGAAFDLIAARVPLLLVLDDLQWVDHSTVDAIAMLARRRSMARLMLIAMNRPLDLLPSDQPLKALKQDLLVHQLCQRIELKPLAEAQVTEYLRADSPQSDLPKGLAELIYRRSGGNPLFMGATLDHLAERGFIAKEQGSWHVKVPLEEVDLGVPETLRQAIEIQIERLSVEEQRALEAASVQGAAFSASICASVINGNTEGYENLYDSMARRRRIVRTVGTQQAPGGLISARCEFVHALYREVLYRRQAPLRRRELHRRLGERLETVYSQQLSEVGSELVYHFEESADWPRTIKYLRLAADAAERRCGHKEVIELLERALSLASRLPAEQRPLTEIEILEKLARILYLTVDPRAPNLYEELASRAAQCGAIDLEVRSVVEMARLWSWSDSRRALELLDRAEQINARQADPLARMNARIMCMSWRRLNGDRHPTDASEAHNAMLELRKAGRVTGPLLIWYSRLRSLCSEYRESQRCALEGLGLLTQGSPVNPCADVEEISAANLLFLNYLFLGEWGEALRVLEATVAELTKNANDLYAHLFRFRCAEFSVFAMDFGGALAICESAASALGEAIIAPSQRFQLTLVGTAQVALGLHDQALEHLSLARHEMDRQSVIGDEYCRFLLESALTELWLAKGDLKQASAQSQQLLEFALGTEERTWQALAWDANTRVAMAQGDLARAVECIASALSTTEAFEVPLADWRVHATAAALDDRAGNVDSAKRHRKLSRTTILKIADSLAPEEPLRKTFLSAAPVAAILGSAAG